MLSSCGAEAAGREPCGIMPTRMFSGGLLPSALAVDRTLRRRSPTRDPSPRLLFHGALSDIVLANVCRPHAVLRRYSNTIVFQRDKEFRHGVLLLPELRRFVSD